MLGNKSDEIKLCLKCKLRPRNTTLKSLVCPKCQTESIKINKYLKTNTKIAIKSPDTDKAILKN